ncbi:HAD-like domain-containing protein [Lentinula aciculospora]|uniref:4-nitrophenylphosphatase n=1 Tax=Lentinula aciculospora TaxID=153920 RepID=A0A9W9DN97_9AGAR|nr:HAD-like domain-containing protein [Lentinula aciculospora]
MNDCRGTLFAIPNMSRRLSASSDYAQLLDKYDTWMFDCDGVLWQGDQLVDGAVEVLRLLRERITFFREEGSVRNQQCHQVSESYKTKFDHLGVEAHVDEIYGSAYATAVYISSVLKLPKEKKVYVIGMTGLEEELRDEGVAYIGGTDPVDKTLESFSLEHFELDPNVAAVVCGLDTTVNYTKLSKAFQYLTRNPGCQFIVTNEDSTYPSGHGLLPGAGAISAPLRYALGKDPISIGKPAKTMLDCIQAKVHYDPARTIMVGDRLNTDILFGQAGGVSTLLVLTGITSERDITGPNASVIVPDFVTTSIGDFRSIK